MRGNGNGRAAEQLSAGLRHLHGRSQLAARMPSCLRSPHGCCSPHDTAAAGHSLLKKKADALNMRFRQILRKIVETKEEMGKVMKVRSGRLSWPAQHADVVR